MMKGLVKKWFVDKGYGFIDIQGHTVFCHADRVEGQGWLKIGEGVRVKVVEDKGREEESWKAAEVMDETRWKRKKQKRR